MNQFFSKISLGKLYWIALFTSLVFPVMCIDYNFTEPKLGQFSMPFGQYLFFGLTLLSAGILFLMFEHPELSEILRDKKIWIFLSLFLTGFLISTPSFWGARLLIIITLVSLSMVIIASAIQNLRGKKQALIAFLMLIPFAVPVYSACILEFFGSFDLGIIFQNSKHTNYQPPRWHFLYTSANGFGFSAALVTATLYISVFCSKKYLTKILICIFCLISLYALILSGTRAAYLFALFSILSFHLLYHGLKSFLWTFGIMVFGFIAICSQYGLYEVLSFLRLDGSNINSMSSERWQGVLEMGEIFSNSPIVGMGFGAADNNFPVWPANMFYVAMPLEVGVIGFVGIMGCLGLPAFYLINNILIQKQFAILRLKPYLSVLSVSLLSGFAPYLMFEFNVLRVSGVNQLFFLCWGIVALEFASQIKR